MTTSKQTNWESNMIQFPRLIAEIVATQELDIQTLADSMDLELSELHELFERADSEWERIKLAIRKSEIVR